MTREIARKKAQKSAWESVARTLVGERVRVTEPGDPFFGGRVLRWGTLREVAADGIMVDGDHDSGGGTAFSARPEDGHLVAWDHVLDLRHHASGG